jgi:hypothetical protein
MIRFLGGLVLGAAGAVYLLAVLLASSREKPQVVGATAQGEPIYQWRTVVSDDPQWTYTTGPIVT